MEQTCRYCDALRQCPYLSDSAGGFVPERLITRDNPRECDRWAPITPRQDSFRQRLCEASAFIGAIKFIHSDLPQMMFKDLALKEMEEARMDGATPDFAGLLREGMSVPEREEQLRYETDDNGNVVLDESGKPFYRPGYQLKQFVTTEGSHVQLGFSIVWFWTTNQLIDHILKAEVEQGLIVKPKKARAPAKTAEQQESEMAGEGRRVMVHQGGKATNPPAPAAAPPQQPPAPVPGGAPVNVQVGGPGRVAAPPMRSGMPGPAPQARPAPTGMPPVGGPAPVMGRGVAAAAPAPVEADPVGVPAAEGDLGAVVQQVVEAALDNLGNELRLAIGTEVKKQLEGLRNELIGNIDAARIQMLQAVTLAYDMAAKTGGQYSWPGVDAEGQQVVHYAPACWNSEDYILELAKVFQGE